MKKIITCCFTGVILCCTTINAQNLLNTPYAQVHSAVEKNILLPDQVNETKQDGSLFLNEITRQAVRNFMRDYKNADDVKWFEAGNGFVVYFFMNGIKAKVYYTKKGNYECMVRNYYEDNLAPAVRHLVKSNYYDFNIYCITEINATGKTAYFLSLEGKTSWKIIKVVDNEMEVTQEYKKG